MQAVEICSKAAELVGGDRAKTHGDKKFNHDAIAQLWNAYLFNKWRVPTAEMHLSATDVALMMALLKIARTQSGGTHHDDNYLDLAGYAGVAGEIAAVERV
jgi:hypothetical protein